MPESGPKRQFVGDPDDELVTATLRRATIGFEGLKGTHFHSPLQTAALVAMHGGLVQA